MAKKARVYDGTAWQELASAQTDLTAYSTTAQMNTAIAAKTGMTLLSTTTLSGASVTISSIPQTYGNLEIWLYGMTNATTGGSIRVAPNGSTTLARAVGTAVADTTSLRSMNGEYIRSTFSLKHTDSNNFARIVISNYASTANHKGLSATYQFLSNADYNITENYGGGLLTNSAITSLVISNSGGNLSTGTVQIWGI